MNDTISAFLSQPDSGYVIAGIFCVGMLVGAIVKHWGWGIKDYALWLMVTLVYILGLSVVLQQAGVHAGNTPRFFFTLLSVGALYWSGVGIGIYIVRREKVKSAKILEKWYECFEEVTNGNGSNRS